MLERLLDARGLPRVVITGMGVISCLGNGRAAFLDALRHDRSGLRAMPEFAERGLKNRVGGPVDLAGLPEPGRKLRRFFPPPALYAWHAMNEALAQAKLPDELLHAPNCGLVFGGGGSLGEHEKGLFNYWNKGLDKVSPFSVTLGMSSSLSANLAHAFDIRGVSFTVSSACASATLAIGQALELIQLGRQQIVLTGGSEELHSGTAMWFEAMHALSAASDTQPQLASRPYDLDRDGIVLAAGAGALVLESLEHANARGATVLAEITGYGFGTDASNMVGPSADGIARTLHETLKRAGTLPDYINTHACSTPQGDLQEWQAIESVFAEQDVPVPPLSSIKGLSGHAPGAAGALDAIASVLMLQHQFVAAGSAVHTADPAFAGMPRVTATHPCQLDRVLTNNFGFGGSCAALMLQRPTDATARNTAAREVAA